MKPSDELHRLIRELDKNEKGYFKKHCSRSGDVDRKYLALFNAIAGQKKYDEAALKKKLRDKSLVRNFASEKNYLHHLLLESLVAAGRAQRKRAGMELLLGKARVLAERSFYNEALKLIRKVREYAAEAEQFELQLAALHEEWQVWPFCDKEKRRPAEIISTERREVLARLALTDGMRTRYTQIHELFRTLGVGRSEAQVKRFTKVFTAAQREAKQALTATAQLYFHNLCTFYYNVAGDYQASYASSRRLIALFDGHPRILENFQSMFISAVNNHVLLELHHEKYAEAENSLARIESIRPLTQRDRNSVFVCRYNSRMDIFLKTLRIPEAYKVTLGLREELPAYEKRIPNRFTGHIQYWAFKSCFYSGRCKEALWWLNRLASARSEDPFPPEVVAVARLSELIVHDALGNDDLLESLLSSARRFLDKNSALYIFEELLLRCFEAHLREPASKKPFKQLLGEMQKQDEGFEQRLLAYFDFDCWAESRATGRSLKELLEKKHRKKTGASKNHGDTEVTEKKYG